MPNPTKSVTEEIGATDVWSCPTRSGYRHTCNCYPKCQVCGYGEHAAVHGPVFGEKPGSKPWGHHFAPALLAAIQKEEA